MILNVIARLLPSCCSFSFALDHGISFLVASNILLLMVVQQLLAILLFSQEKMSACPSTPYLGGGDLTVNFVELMNKLEPDIRLE